MEKIKIANRRGLLFIQGDFQVTPDKLRVEYWSELDGEGLGTIRTEPENYYVATILSDESLEFEGIEAMTRNVDQDIVRDWFSKQASSNNELKKKADNISPENKDAIIDFIKDTPDVDDEVFHQFVESLGIEPDEAEEVIYEYVNRQEGMSAPMFEEKYLKPIPAGANKMDKITIKKQAVSETAYDEYLDVLDILYGGNHEAFVEALISAMGDDELRENLEYIKRMGDYTSIKEQMGEE